MQIKTIANHKTFNTKLLLGFILLFSVLASSSAFAVKPIYSGGKERAAIWLFSSQQNLDAFKANPAKYKPQYGGYCAYAVSNGATASIKPEFFTIHDDKLYLNYSKSVYNKWLKDKEGYISEANSEWVKILAK